MILGASGAGKSSFLRAGLLPRLARVPGRFLPLPAIRPEHSALFGENGLLCVLEAALPKRTRGEIRAAIRGGADQLARALLSARQAPRSRIARRSLPTERNCFAATAEGAASSFRPRPMVLAAMPVIRDAAGMPP